MQWYLENLERMNSTSSASDYHHFFSCLSRYITANNINASSLSTTLAGIVNGNTSSTVVECVISLLISINCRNGIVTVSDAHLSNVGVFKMYCKYLLSMDSADVSIDNVYFHIRKSLYENYANDKHVIKLIVKMMGSSRVSELVNTYLDQRDSKYLVIQTKLIIEMIEGNLPVITDLKYYLDSIGNNDSIASFTSSLLIPYNISTNHKFHIDNVDNFIRNYFKYLESEERESVKRGELDAVLRKYTNKSGSYTLSKKTVRMITEHPREAEREETKHEESERGGSFDYLFTPSSPTGCDCYEM